MYLQHFFALEIGQQRWELALPWLLTMVFYCLSAASLSWVGIACRQKCICLPQYPRIILWAVEKSKFLRNPPSPFRPLWTDGNQYICASHTQQPVEDGQWKHKPIKKNRITETEVWYDSWYRSIQRNHWNQLNWFSVIFVLNISTWLHHCRGVASV